MEQLKRSARGAMKARLLSRFTLHTMANDHEPSRVIFGTTGLEVP